MKMKSLRQVRKSQATKKAVKSRLKRQNRRNPDREFGRNERKSYEWPTDQMHWKHACKSRFFKIPASKSDKSARIYQLEIKSARRFLGTGRWKMIKLQNRFSLNAIINKESPQGRVPEDELCTTGSGGQGCWINANLIQSALETGRMKYAGRTDFLTFIRQAA
jgi:hypothetical protein